MGDKKRRFVVERLKKVKEDSKNEEIKRKLEELDKDGKFHLLLLKQTPYIKV
jgi:RNA binding exosome subunit